MRGDCTPCPICISRHIRYNPMTVSTLTRTYFAEIICKKIASGFRCCFDRLPVGHVSLLISDWDHAGLRNASRPVSVMRQQPPENVTNPARLHFCRARSCFRSAGKRKSCGDAVPFQAANARMKRICSWSINVACFRRSRHPLQALSRRCEPMPWTFLDPQHVAIDGENCSECA